MSSPEIADLCREIRALGQRAKGSDAEINFDANRHVGSFFAAGPGLLGELPARVRGKPKKKQPIEEDESLERADTNEFDNDGDDSGSYMGDGSANPDPEVHTDSDEEDTDSWYRARWGSEPFQLKAFTERNVVKYLKKLRKDIETKQRTPGIYLPLGISGTPDAHQLKAAGVIKQAGQSRFKGMILADPMGGGKTLSALLAISESLSPERGPCLVVVPPSCARQWMKEIGIWFPKMRALHLDKANVSPVELFKYDVVVVSYFFVVSDLTRPEKFMRKLARYGSGETQQEPKRPNCCLTSEVFELKHARRWGKLLVLDEAHTIKNTNSQNYKAIQAIRGNFDTCVMLTGTPLDNTWHDTFALLFLLEGHPFHTVGHMTNAFVSEYEKDGKNDSKLVPKWEWFARYAQLMDAVTLRRPLQEISSNLPSAVRTTVWFSVEEKWRNASNEQFLEFKKSIAMLKSEPGSWTSSTKKVNWAALVRAHQYVTHPSLVGIMAKLQKLARNDRDIMDDDEEALDRDANVNDGANLNTQQKDAISKWQRGLKQERGWRSGRVDCIMDQLNQIRDGYPNDKVLIFDESVFFLDVLAVMMEETDDPMPFLRFDGQHSSAERHVVLDKFKEMPGFAVLLCTRGTGGQGLNMQMANHVILCSPWWKEAWVAQAIARSLRTGQTKVVRVYDMKARGAGIERHKEECSAEKEKFNLRVIREIERSDSQQDVERRRLDYA